MEKNRNYIFQNILEGTKKVPSKFICYVFLVGLDLYTTYLGTPDLKYESNIVIKYFNLGWTGILFWATIGVVIMIYAVLISIKTLTHQLKNFINLSPEFSNQKNSVKETIYERSYHKKTFKFIFLNKKTIISFFFLSAFYTHFCFSIFVCINNYLGYIFVTHTKNYFELIAIKYVNFYNSIGHFHIYIQLLTVAIGLICSYIHILRLIKKN